MSKATWEEEIEDRLDLIVKELRVLQEMVGVAMGPTAKIPPKKKREPPKKQDGDEEQPYKFINTLQVGDKNVNVKGTIMTDPVQRDVDTKEGPAPVTNMLIDDGSGALRIAFWGDFADEAMDYQNGDLVLIEKLYRITEPYEGVLQASAGKFFKMVKLN